MTQRDGATKYVHFVYIEIEQPKFKIIQYWKKQLFIIKQAA